MTRRISAESFVSGPLALDWTIGDLLEWIGADDARCHDVALVPLLDAVNEALAAPRPRGTAQPVSLRAVGTPARAGASPVAAVRALALRVTAEPAVGERRVAELIVPAPAPVPVPQREDRETLLAV